MSHSPTVPRLAAEFAHKLPELSVPVSPQPGPAPQMLLLNTQLAEDLGLDPDLLSSDPGLQFLLGQHLDEDAVPVAQNYAGHQFGAFSPVLGDGRAVLLGELTCSATGRRVDLHLKGSGLTPFGAARAGDGKAVLGPVLREYLISEAMHALGIATARALAVILTGERVVRGRETQPGAILVRVADSHLRVGSVQLARHVKPRSDQSEEVLDRLIRLALTRHAPDRLESDRPAAQELLAHTVHAQAELVASWMRLGFVHGVMNTDNMTLSGQTIDYGPCAFVDRFDPTAVFSSIDTNGRYAFGNQPAVAEWNLSRLAEALLPKIDPDPNRALEIAEHQVREFAPAFVDAYERGLAAKVGLAERYDDDHRVRELVRELPELWQETRVDLTQFFLGLSRLAGTIDETDTDVLGETERARTWLTQWRALEPETSGLQALNPRYIPRNHLVEEALGDSVSEVVARRDRVSDSFTTLWDLVTHPYDWKPDTERFEQPAPESFTHSFQTFCGT